MKKVAIHFEAQTLPEYYEPATCTEGDTCLIVEVFKDKTYAVITKTIYISLRHVRKVEEYEV